MKVLLAFALLASVSAFGAAPGKMTCPASVVGSAAWQEQILRQGIPKKVMDQALIEVWVPWDELAEYSSGQKDHDSPNFPRDGTWQELSVEGVGKLVSLNMDYDDWDGQWACWFNQGPLSARLDKADPEVFPEYHPMPPFTLPYTRWNNPKNGWPSCHYSGPADEGSFRAYYALWGDNGHNNDFVMDGPRSRDNWCSPDYPTIYFFPNDGGAVEAIRGSGISTTIDDTVPGCDVTDAYPFIMWPNFWSHIHVPVPSYLDGHVPELSELCDLCLSLSDDDNFLQACRKSHFC